MQYDKKNKLTLSFYQVNLTHSEINLSTVSEPSDIKRKLTKLTKPFYLLKLQQLQNATQCISTQSCSGNSPTYSHHASCVDHVCYNVQHPNGIIQSIITFTQ